MGEVKDFNKAYVNLSGFNWAQKTVMVVEDDRTHRAMLEKILTECGIAATLAENGCEALERIDAGEKFDLIIMDWDMPGLNGLETVYQIRERQAHGKIPHMPVVAFTASNTAEDRKKCLDAGMDAFLPKDVLLPRWRQSLMDNLLQGLITDDLDMSDINLLPLESEQMEENVFDLDAFDGQALKQTAALLKGEFAIAVDEYLEDAAAYIREIREGLENGDADKAARGSHPLKSNSKGFGLIAVARIAEAINGTTRKGEMPDKELLPQLLEAFKRAEKKLREVIRQT